MAFTAFPSIEQFRNLVRNVSLRAAYNGRDETGAALYTNTQAKPSLCLAGTVKIHGTNAAIVLTPDGRIEAQSRSKTLVAPDDNAGFRAFVESIPREEILKLFPLGPATLFGEWAGRGIQKGVGVALLERFFVICARLHPADASDVEMAGEVVSGAWFGGPGPENPAGVADLPAELPAFRIFDITHPRFPQYRIQINFDDPASVALAQNEMVRTTNEVEAACPVATAIAAIDGVPLPEAENVGEGVVWFATDDGYRNPKFWCKVKGEKHSVSKVRTLASADVEKVASVAEFVEKVVTENRLRQGLDALRERGIALDPASTGEFIRWVTGDVAKEESDTLAASGLMMQDVGKVIGTKARAFFLSHLG